MNQNLISIDDDSLDMVSGGGRGGLFTAVGGALDATVGTAVCLTGEVVHAGVGIIGGTLKAGGRLLSGLGSFLTGC